MQGIVGDSTNGGGRFWSEETCQHAVFEVVGCCGFRVNPGTANCNAMAGGREGGGGLAAGCFWCEVINTHGTFSAHFRHIFSDFVFAEMPFELQFCHLSLLFLRRILQLC